MAERNTSISRTRKLLAICIVLVVSFSIIAAVYAQNKVAQEAANISIIRLIATPDQFHGKRVRVEGYLRLEFEGNALYLHAEDYKQGLTYNSVWLEIPPAQYKANLKLNNRYVLIEGMFDAKKSGHMGLFSGEIKQINRIRAIRPGVILLEDPR